MKNIFIIGIILMIGGSLVGGFIGNISYNYEINKCNNLKSTESNYDFDIKLETNANYNSDCYYLNNHPLSFVSYISGGLVGGGLLTGITLMWIFILVEMIKPSDEMNYY